ncbi:WYL domain-containing transcriptional regulator [Clostridium perfringens]|uniref:helix-turn-helix transcriptional regulator n=1 Tax=Clostridium perfringens TaxID=1502 RepID=UPI0022E3F44E|nr:WYL domain-containing protein [Clostridium perfringens]EJT5937077.1 WYL domain-containing transcriptional regulator [Clostridium perfringens]
MSTLGNTLRMLIMLRSGRKLKVKEIAEELEVSEKQVKRYKEALSEFFYIESKSGIYGGYILRDKYIPIKELLDEYEINLLKYSIDALEDFSLESNKDLKRAIDKINYSIEKGHNSNNEKTNSIIPYGRSLPINNKLQEMIDVIFEAIISNKEVFIEYSGNNGEVSKRTIQPYKIFTFKGEQYVIANCLSKNQVRYFKLIRIKGYHISNKIFKKTLDVDKLIENNKKNSIGIFGGKKYNLILEITPPIANTIKEKIWVDNQEVIELENGKILFKATMEGLPEIISWILSMREYVKIIEPLEIKEEVRLSVQKIINNLY